MNSAIGPMIWFVGGFFAGQLVSSIAARFLGLVLTSVAKHGGEFLGPPRRRLLGVLPIAAVLHPGLSLGWIRRWGCR
jgi:hypothetical protein